MTDKHERLIKLADLMEQNADDPKFLKELNREYKAIARELYPVRKCSNAYTAKQIKESWQKALEQIKIYLDTDNIEEQFNDRNGNYYSNDKFLVSWVCNYKGFPHEVSIDKCDSFYFSYSGAKCIVARRSLVSEKQLKAYSSFERAFIEQGLKLCATKTEKKGFFDKYAERYNKRIRDGK